MKTHDEIQDLLEGYVDETLDRATYRTLEVHLKSCDECRAILDEVASVDLSGLVGGAVDERTLRRSVRRAMRRTVFDTALALLALWLVVWLVAALIVQPLVINRGGRAAIAARATYDIAMMSNEGAVVTDFDISSSLLHRVFSADLGLPVGSGSIDLGTVASGIGMIGFRDADGRTLWPYVENRDAGGPGGELLSRLGSGTVATVAVRFDDPISIDRAQEFADSSDHDVRVVWAGFPIATDAERFDWRLSLDGVLGYPTCLNPRSFGDDLFGATSAGAGQSFGSASASVQGALDEVRGALENLATNPQIIERLVGRESSPSEEVKRAIAYLNQPDPGVVTLVVTGPTTELLGFLDDARADSSWVLAVDFYNWSDPVCGR